MTIPKPKISLVIAARNDDYGGDFLNRISTCLKILNYQVNKNKVPAELIIIEYNPPNNKQLLSEVLQINKSDFLSIRFINVPSKFHQDLAQGSKNPFFEYVAKNIGIKRANGEFILATNPDIIFSEEFIKFISNDQLEKNKFYRINRHDLPAHIFGEVSTEKEILDWCKNHVIRIMTNNGILFFNTKRWLKRFLKRPTFSHLLRLPLFNFLTERKIKLDPNRISGAAAGDFIMAHSDAWHKVRGYDQIPFNSFVDGYNVHMFHCYGFEQQILPYPVYHMGHKTSNNSRKQPDFKTYLDTVSKMDETKIPYKKYPEDWGFPDIDFKEIVI